MPLSKDDLEAKMIHALQAFNYKNVDITGDTKFNEALSSDDAFGFANSANAFHTGMAITLHNSGNGTPKWPSNWMSMTVDALATALAPG